MGNNPLNLIVRLTASIRKLRLEVEKKNLEEAIYLEGQVYDMGQESSRARSLQVMALIAKEIVNKNNEIAECENLIKETGQ